MAESTRERRGLFELFFGRPRAESPTRTYLRMLNSFTPTFHPFTGDAWESDIVRAAVDAFARHVGKLRARHIRRHPDGKIEYVRSRQAQLLSTQPNPYMDAYSFMYKLGVQWLTTNNAIVYEHRDPVTHELLGYYPVMASTIELLQAENDPAGEIYARFRFASGQKITLPYTSLIHLRRHFNKHDLFGDSNDKALRPSLELIRTTDDGIINAIKHSAALRGILKFTGMLKPEDMRAQRDRFVEEYLSINNDGGIGAIDSKAEFIPTRIEPHLPNAAQMKLIKDKIYDYFGVNDFIVQGRYNENQWNAWYESSIEPFAVQASLAFTSRLFTERERGHGNEIVFDANRLQYASTTTKLSLVQMVDRGALTPNEWREAMNLPPIEGGDKPIRRLDTAEVGQAPANSGKDGDDDGDAANEDTDDADS